MLTGNPQARLIVDNALNAPRPQSLKWLPAAVWRLVSTPIRRTLGVGILIGVPDEVHQLLGLRRTRLDKIDIRPHRLVWHAVPRTVSRQFAPAYFTARRAIGTPAWRAEYSRPNLADNQ
jgi:hypothetical protein